MPVRSIRRRKKQRVLFSQAFYPGSLLSAGVTMANVRRLGEENVHFAVGYRNLRVMVVRKGLDYGPDPTPAMLATVRRGLSRPTATPPRQWTPPRQSAPRTYSSSSSSLSSSSAPARVKEEEDGGAAGAPPPVSPETAGAEAPPPVRPLATRGAADDGGAEKCARR